MEARVTPKPRLEKHEQADGVQLLRTLGAAVYVLGTVRAKGDHPGTRQTPGLPDVMAFLPPRGLMYGAEFLCWEVKRAGGRLRPEQVEFQAHCRAAGVAHVVGDLTALMVWLVEHRYLRRESLSYERYSAVVAAQGARA